MENLFRYGIWKICDTTVRYRTLPYRSLLVALLVYRHTFLRTFVFIYTIVLLVAVRYIDTVFLHFYCQFLLVPYRTLRYSKICFWYRKVLYRTVTVPLCTLTVLYHIATAVRYVSVCFSTVRRTYVQYLTPV